MKHLRLRLAKVKINISKAKFNVHITSTTVHHQQHCPTALCVLAYHCVHGTAPAYLADSLRLTSDVVARRLRSVDSPTLNKTSEDYKLNITIITGESNIHIRRFRITAEF